MKNSGLIETRLSISEEDVKMDDAVKKILKGIEFSYKVSDLNNRPTSIKKVVISNKHR